MIEEKYLIKPSEVEVDVLVDFLIKNVSFEKVMKIYNQLNYLIENVKITPNEFELLKYKNAWNELKEGIEINMDYYDSSKFKELVSLNHIEELEQKYNLGGE